MRGAALLARLELEESRGGSRSHQSRRRAGMNAEPAANPFAQDVAEPLPGPTTLVIFGATGDLAARKLLPAIYNLGLGGLLPERFEVIGIGRRAGDSGGVPPPCPRGDRRRYSRTGIEDDAWGALEPRLDFLNGRLRRPEAVRGPQVQDRGEGRRRAGAARLLPRGLVQLLRRDRQGARSGRARRRRRPSDPAHDREAVRPRPRLGAGAGRRHLVRLRRVAGLPHRPLPGQGDGPEPPGAAVRERDPRADLEPPLRRARPDHHGRGHRDRPPRRLLRLAPARSAT